MENKSFKNRKKSKFKNPQKDTPIYKCLTKIQLFWLLIIPICSFLFSDMYDEVEALAAASGLYFYFLFLQPQQKKVWHI